MSGSNRVTIIALGLIALISWSFFTGWIYGASLNLQEQRYQPYIYAADKALKADPVPSGVPESRPFEYRTPCNQPTGKDESELCAQWRAANAAEDSAFWAKWGFWATGVGMVGLIFTIIQGHVSLDRARDANDIARQAQRAWLVLTSHPTTGFVPRSEDPSVLHSKFWFKLRNCGQEPALMAKVYHDIHFMPINSDPVNEWEEFCKRSSGNLVQTFGAILPTAEESGDFYHNLDLAEVRGLVAKEPCYAWSFVRVDYETTSGPGRTCIRHYVGQRDGREAEARAFRDPIIEDASYDFVWAMLAKNGSIEAE